MNCGNVAFVGRSVIKNFMLLCSTITGPFGFIDLVDDEEFGGARALPVGIFMLFVSNIMQFIALMAQRSPILQSKIQKSYYLPHSLGQDKLFHRLNLTRVVTDTNLQNR